MDKTLMKTLEDKVDKIEDAFYRIKQVTIQVTSDTKERAKQIIRNLVSRPSREIKVTEVQPEYTKAVELLTETDLLCLVDGKYKPGLEFYRVTESRVGCCHSYF
ncbi:MAG: hypothetical protein V1839_01035 [archaeon]